jgi:predicted MFS family arabinose efflux permease
LVSVVIPDSKDPHAVRLDVAGVSTFSAFLFLTTLALISGNHDGWTSPHILAEVAGALAFFALFIVVEMRQTRPMVDFSFFRKPTYLGANIAQFAFAAGLLTMLTFVPIYFQHGLGMSPGHAGLAMLPMALPLFVVPRVTTSQLSHRFTGRALLTAGLLLVAAGLALVALGTGLDYRTMLAGMLVAGIGAGLLNGETTKVGMTVIPPTRAGMASGISGTMRFTGIVIGFAAFGVVLFSRISAAITTALPLLGDDDRMALTRAVVSGDVSSTGIGRASDAMLRAVAAESFDAGYATLFTASAGFCLLAAALTCWLVRAADTPPLAK